LKGFQPAAKWVVPGACPREGGEGTTGGCKKETETRKKKKKTRAIRENLVPRIPRELDLPFSPSRPAQPQSFFRGFPAVRRGHLDRKGSLYLSTPHTNGPLTQKRDPPRGGVGGGGGNGWTGGLGNRHTSGPPRFSPKGFSSPRSAIRPAAGKPGRGGSTDKDLLGKARRPGRKKRGFSRPFEQPPHFHGESGVRFVPENRYGEGRGSGKSKLVKRGREPLKKKGEFFPVRLRGPYCCGLGSGKPAGSLRLKI